MLRALGRELSSDFQKICVTAATLDPIDDESPTGFAIYIIELSPWDTLERQPIKPDLEWDFDEFPPVGGTAVLGTKLYLFGGMDKSRSPFVPEEDGQKCYGVSWLSDVYVYDIKHAISSSSSQEAAKLHKSSVHERLDMRGRKHSPRAAIIDDYRICVFATQVFYWQPPINRVPHRRSTPPNFELLDTRDNSWTPLPELMDYESMRRKNSQFTLTILSFSVKRSTLIVGTNIGTLYRMKFDAPNPQWEELPFEIPDDPGFYRAFCSVVHGAIIFDKVLCTPHQFLVVGDSPKSFPITLRNEKGKTDFSCPQSGALCLEDRDMVFIVRSGKDCVSEEYFLWFDTLIFNNVLGLHPKPINVKFVRFPLHSKPIEILGCFQIKIKDVGDSIQA